MNANRRQRVNAALHAFLHLPLEDQRVLVEILRRVVSGSPLEHAMEQVTGSREVPQQWRTT